MKILVIITIFLIATSTSISGISENTFASGDLTTERGSKFSVNLDVSQNNYDERNITVSALVTFTSITDDYELELNFISLKHRDKENPDGYLATSISKGSPNFSFSYPIGSNNQISLFWILEYSDKTLQTIIFGLNFNIWEYPPQDGIGIIEDVTSTKFQNENMIEFTFQKPDEEDKLFFSSLIIMSSLLLMISKLRKMRINHVS